MASLFSRRRDRSEAAPPADRDARPETEPAGLRGLVGDLGVLLAIMLGKDMVTPADLRTSRSDDRSAAGHRAPNR